MSTMLRKKAKKKKKKKKKKKRFWKDFFKLINNALFEKTMGNVRNFGDIKLEATEASTNYLISVPNYRTTTSFLQNVY